MGLVLSGYDNHVIEGGICGEIWDNNLYGWKFYLLLG